MAKLNSYTGCVDVIDGLRPINGNSFPIVQAHDVQVYEDGTRLDEVLENIGAGGGGGTNILTFDSVEDLPDDAPEGTIALVPSEGAIGLPPVTADNNGAFLQVVDGAWAVVALQDVSKEGA